MLQYVVSSILIIVSLLLTVTQQKLGPGHWASPYLNQFSTTILISGLLSVLFKAFTERDSQKKLEELFKLHESVVRSGLKEVFLDSKSYNFASLLESSQVLTIVANDGLRWGGNYSVELSKRFSREMLTEFFLVGENSDFVPILAAKVGMSKGEVQEKLRQSFRLIKDTYEASSKKGNIHIYAMKNFPTHTVYRGENAVIITPYQISSGRRAVPLYVFENERSGTVAAEVIEDLGHLRQESTLVTKLPPDP